MRFVLIAVVGSLLLAGTAWAVEAAPPAEKEQPKTQAVCPVMGGAIDKDIHADHDGKRVYFCCKACVDTFKKDPAKYIEKLEKDGVTLDVVCACGHVKGTEECKKSCQDGKCGDGACKGGCKDAAKESCGAGATCPAGKPAAGCGSRGGCTP